MTRRATADNLTRPRTTAVTVNVVDPDTGDVEPQEFIIQRFKAGHRKTLQAESVTDGILDLEHANRLTVALCCIDPALTIEQVEEIDIDIVVELADLIAKHSEYSDVTQAATPDPVEGADAARGFLDESGTASVVDGMAADRLDDADGLDA